MKCGEVTSHNDSQIDPILDNIDPVTVNDWKNEPVHKWCPKQNSCNSTPLCQPCKRRFLIIIATGRSGSTTLTHMLGSLPGVRMAGENDNALRRIFMVSNSRQKTTGFWFKKGAKGSIYSKQNGPWQHNPVPFQGLACAEQHFIEAIIPPALAADGDYRYSQPADGHILGFKTIRFLYELGGPNAIPEEDFNTYLKWFVNAFPCARIVINIRSDTMAQAQSRKDAFFPQKDVNEMAVGIADKNQKYVGLAEHLGDRAYLLDSSKWTKNVTKFHGLIDWLGYSEECYFKYLLEYNTHHAYGSNKNKAKYKYKHDKKCNYTGEHKAQSLNGGQAKVSKRP